MRDQINSVPNERLRMVQTEDHEAPLSLLSITALKSANKTETKHSDPMQRELNSTPESLAVYLEAALHKESMTSNKQSYKKIWHLLAEESSETIEKALKLMPPPYNGDRRNYEFNFDTKLRTLLEPESAEKIQRMLSEKARPEIPAGQEKKATALLKADSPVAVGKTQEVEMEDGRVFDIYIPRTLRTYKENGQEKVPSIVALHGVVRKAAFDSHHIKEVSGLNQVAEREGVVVMYPHATQRTKLPAMLAWSTPGREDLVPSSTNQVDDIAELHRMREFVKNKIIPLGIKSGFIGHSDGGRMAQAYGIEHPEEVAYLVPWSSTWMIKDSGPNRALPTRIILNDGDETLPITGGQGRNSRIGDLFLNTNVKDSRPMMMQEVWGKANGCSGQFDKLEEQNGKITKQVFKNCTQPLEVDLIHGSSHSIADWHSMGGTPTSPADTSVDMTYNVVKGMMPYLVRPTASA